MSWRKPGHLKAADQDTRYTVEQSGNRCRFPQLLFCPGLLLIVLDRPKGSLWKSCPPAEQGWASGSVAEQGEMKGFTDSEGEILVLWKGSSVAGVPESQGQYQCDHIVRGV